MRRLLPALLLLAAARPAWGHPMPSSAVVLRLHRAEIDAELTLPIGELAMGWEKPLPMDAVRTVRQYGEELKDYVRAHVRPIRSRRAALDGDGARGDPGRRAGTRRAGGVDDDPAARRARGPADLPLRRDLPPPDHPHGGGHAGQRLAQRRDGRGAGAPGDDARHQRRDRHRPLRGQLVPGIRRHVPPRCAPHRRGDRPPAVPARADPPRAAGRGGRALGRLCRREDGLAADRQGRDRVHPRPLDHARARRAGMGAPARRLRRIGHRPVDPGLGRPRPGPDLPRAGRSSSPAASGWCTAWRSRRR